MVVSADKAEESSFFWLSAMLTGIMTRQPIILMKIKMLRSILVKRREDGRIQANRVDQLCLASLDDGLDPGEEALPTGGGGVFLIRMLDLGGIDERVTGTKEGKCCSEEDGDTMEVPREAHRALTVNLRMVSFCTVFEEKVDIQQIEKDPR